MIRSLDVYIWGKKAGTLMAYKEKYNEKVCFYFDKDFIHEGWDISPLQASIHSVAAQHGMPVYADEGRLYGGLPSFIADSLPDDWGNRVFATWAKANNIKAKDISSLDRLAYMGSRALGAFEFVPAAAANLEKGFAVAIDKLYRAAQVTMQEAKDFKAELTPDLLIDSLFRVGTSAGGRRPKAIIHVNRNTGECISGQVPAPNSDFTPCIIKFEEHNGIPTTRIEYSYYLMAQEAGLQMMPCWLLEGSQECHFLTKRFDRIGGQKIHTQTLAAINPQADSYEELIGSALKIGVPPSEVQQLFRQMTLNVLCGNVDDHSKNFCFMMRQDGLWHVSPAYDFTFSVDPSAPHYVNSHSLNICNKRTGITQTDLMQVAQKYNIKGAKSIINKCRQAALAYHIYAEKAAVGKEWTDIICKEINERMAE